MTEDKPPFQPLSPEKKKRNWAIFGVLLALVALIYTITLIKLGVRG